MSLLVQWSNHQRDCYMTFPEKSKSYNIKVLRLDHLGFDWNESYSNDVAGDQREDELDDESMDEDAPSGELGGIDVEPVAIRLNPPEPVETPPSVARVPRAVHPIRDHPPLLTATVRPVALDQEDEDAKIPAAPGCLDEKWNEMFRQLMDFRMQKGHMEVPPTTPEGKALCKWMQAQRVAYKHYQDGTYRKPLRKGAMNESKIDRLNRLGFDWTLMQTTTQQAPQERWYAMLERLKEYSERHKTFEVEVPDGDDDDEQIKQLQVLKRWVDTQRYQYRAFRDGEPMALITERKIQNLESIGFRFNYEPFPVRLEQYKKFREENKKGKVPEDHPLHDWVKLVRRQMRRFEKGDGKYNKLTQEQYDQLVEAQVIPRRVFKEPEDPAIVWQRNMEQLRRYKQEHGDCMIKMTNPTTEFQKWILSIRSWYNQLESGKDSPTALRELTPMRMKALVDIGFAFWQRPKYSCFEKRLQELKEYKEKHGTTNVPCGQRDGLGNFVSNCRNEYRKLIEGEKSKLDEKKVEALKELGFKFQVGPRRQRKYKPFPWEVRIQQLAAYKKEVGHTVVPQHYTGFNNLGKWVQTQRKYYNKMKKGISTPLTEERVLQLADIGFVWDAIYKLFRKKGARRRPLAASRPQFQPPQELPARLKDDGFSSSGEDDLPHDPERFWY